MASSSSTALEFRMTACVSTAGHWRVVGGKEREGREFGSIIIGCTLEK